MTQTELTKAIRQNELPKIAEDLTNRGEHVLRVAENAIAFPVVDSEGGEWFCKITISIPTGSRDGTPFLGYEEAENYAFECEEKARKKAKQAERKRKKAEKDERNRRLKKEISEKRNSK